MWSRAHLLPFPLGRMKLFLPHSPHTRCLSPTEIPLVLWGLSKLLNEEALRLGSSQGPGVPPGKHPVLAALPKTLSPS